MMRITHAVALTRRSFDTVPQRLVSVCYVTFVGVLMVSLAVVMAVHGAREGMRTIEHIARSIFIAQELRARVADTHAEAANAMLVGGLGTPEDRQPYRQHLYTSEDRQPYRQHLYAVANLLVRAAQNITSLEGSPPIHRLQHLLVTYTGLIAEGQTETRHGNPVGRAVLLRADRLMQMELLPAIQELDEGLDDVNRKDFKAYEARKRRSEEVPSGLDDVNRKDFKERYDTRQTWALIAIITVLVLGVALTLVLAFCQVYLYRTFHRRYNPYLLLASATTLLLTAYAGWALSESQAHLRRAKENTFRRVDTLLQIRAAAINAKGALSLGLLEHGRGKKYEDRFKKNTDQILVLDPTVTAELHTRVGQTAAAVHQSEDDLKREVWARVKQAQPAGLLGDALAQVTSADEAESATASLVFSYVRFLELATRIQTLDGEGKHEEAVKLYSGAEDRQGRGVLDHLDKALEMALATPKGDFTRSVTEARHVLNGLDIGAPVVLSLVFFCTLQGLKPRLAEFR
jgi:hypothetical protein